MLFDDIRTYYRYYRCLGCGLAGGPGFWASWDWSTPRDHTELFAGVMSITSGEIQEKTLDSVALKLGEI